MKTHILIPSINSYGIMILIVLSFGSFNIARHIHIRWLKKYFSFMGSNAIVKSIIVLLGFSILDVDNLFVWSAFYEFFGLLVGIFLGWITIFLETRMIRMVNRKKLMAQNRQVNQGENFLRNAIVTSKISLFTPKKIRAKGLKHVRQEYSQYAREPSFLNYSLLSVIIVAVSEEFLFRGYAISIAELMHSKIMACILILLSIILFAFSHMANSWIEFKSKLPLSILTMIGFLFTGTLLSAITTHVMLNIYAYFQLKKFKLEKTKHHYLPIGVMK